MVVGLQGDNATDLARQHQMQLLQRQQFQRQQMMSKSQQQFRQQAPQQSPSRSPMGQFGGTSPMPQHYVNTPTSPMPPQSPQFPGNSPHSQSPMLTNSSPIMPQSPMPGGNVQFQQNVTSPHPQSPMVQYVNQTPNSPLHPLSPRVQQNFGNNPQSPITTPQSPMIQQSYTPNSPMHHFSQPSSPRPPQSPRIQSQFQHPSSPMGAPQSPHPHIQQNQMQNQFVHRPNSPIRSPMPPASPMPIRRPSSTGASPQVEQMMGNQSPRMNYGGNEEMNQGGGGGNPHLNPIPAPPGLFGRFGYIKLGLRGGSPMWGDRTPIKRPTLSGKTINTNEPSQFEHSAASTSKSPQKKSESIETQEGAMKNDEETVYDDIVLVENETNLEVEELQSSLHGNVMGIPMVIDGDNMRVSDINLDPGNVELEDCLVSSTNLVVLDVDRSGSGEETEACLLDMVDKDEAESMQGDSLMLEEDMGEEESKDDESDMIEMMEESMSPPTGRKRLVGKVLPGESLKKLQEKRDSTTDTPDSPEPEDVTNEQSPEAYTSETDNEMVTSTFESKPEPQEEQEKKQEEQERLDNVKQVFPMALPPGTQIPPSSAHQANMGVTRTTVSYPSYPRGVPRHVFPLIRTDGRSVIAVQQAAVANLVQDAVNAAKLAAEKKQFPQNVSIGGNLIPTLMSTPSTLASIGVVSTTGTTLIAPPRMSVPMTAATRITQSSAQTTHFMPILSQSRGGVLKIEVINQKVESEGDKQQQAVSRQVPTTEIPEGFQKHFVDSVSQNLSREESKRNEQVQIIGPHPSKAHSYSKLLVEESKTQDSSQTRVDNSLQSNFSDFMQRSGVICAKTTASGNSQSSVITQVSVINEGKNSQQEETPPISTGSSILEAQLTASTREEMMIPRNPAVSSPSKTLFSFLEQSRDVKKQQREPQSGMVNLLDMSVTYDDNKAHTESVTLYRSSENIMTQSNISQMLKTQQQSDSKFPVSMMSQLSEKQEGLQTQPAIRRIGNIYVHAQPLKADESEGETQRIVYQGEQNRQKIEQTPVIKTDIKAASNISELFRQKPTFFEQKSFTTQHQEVDSPFTTSNSSMTPTKTVPTRLGELISGGTNVHAHIERRLSIAGQNDLDLAKAQMQNFNNMANAQNQNNMVENMQQKSVSSSEANSMFIQRETKDSSSQFIPLSAILTPKSDPDDKR